MAQHLHLTSSCRKGSALTSDLILSERICNYIWPHLVRKALHLHSTMLKNIASKGLLVLDWGFLVTDQVHPFSQRMASSLISDQVVTHPSITSKWPCTHIWSCKTTSYSHIKMAPSPILSYLVTDQLPPFQEWHLVLTSDHLGTNPIVTSKWLSTHIWHARNQSSHHDIMAQCLHLTMEGTNPLTMSE